MIVQIYAFTDPAQAREAALMGVDHIGFVAGDYGLVPAELSFAQARTLCEALPDSAVAVALTLSACSAISKKPRSNPSGWWCTRTVIPAVAGVMRTMRTLYGSCMAPPALFRPGVNMPTMKKPPPMRECQK